MYNLLPDTNVTDNINGRDAVEYAWDFEKNDFKLINGRTYTVTGVEAIKIWVWKVLQVTRNRFPIYTLAYGNEISKVVGYNKDLAIMELQRYIIECLTVNPYIIEVDNFDIILEKDSVYVAFTVHTTYGQLEETVTMYI